MIIFNKITLFNKLLAIFFLPGYSTISYEVNLITLCDNERNILVLILLCVNIVQPRNILFYRTSITYPLTTSKRCFKLNDTSCLPDVIPE